MGESAAASTLSVGTMLAQTYKVTRLLGRGGMGAVWEAEHARLPGKRVAVKVLHAEVAGDEESLARFRREAEIASRLGHPNIVDVTDFNVLPDGSPYLVLEFLEGEDLSERLRRGPMPLDEVASVIRQVGSALRAAHAQNIVHRDLKPQNVFLVPTEAGGFVHVQAKVLDFGISKIRGSQTVKTNAADMLGTPQYMAPEQATGQHDAVDARTDVFALGAMVYEMLAGEPAFPGQSIPEVVFKVVYEDPRPLANLVQVPPGVADAVHKALSKKQEDRFDDVSSFVHALTGSPLDTLQKGAVIARPYGSSGGAPTGGGVRTGDALAATIDSGRAAVDPALAPVTATGRAQAARNDALAATVDSSKSGVVVPAPTEPPLALAETTAAPAARSGKGMWIGIGLVAIAAAAVAVALIVTGGGGGGGEPVQPAAAGATDDDDSAGDIGDVGAIKVTNAGELGKQIDDAVNQGLAEATAGLEGAAKDITENLGKVDLGNPANASGGEDIKNAKNAKDTKDTKDAKKPPKDDGDDKDEPKVPGEVRAELVKAEGLLRAGKANEALVAARRTTYTKPTDTAKSIMARAYCQMNNFGMAKATLRGIGRRAVKRQVVRYCAKQGHDLTP